MDSMGATAMDSVGADRDEMVGPGPQWTLWLRTAVDSVVHDRNGHCGCGPQWTVGSRTTVKCVVLAAINIVVTDDN